MSKIGSKWRIFYLKSIIWPLHFFITHTLYTALKYKLKIIQRAWDSITDNIEKDEYKAQQKMFKDVTEYVPKMLLIGMICHIHLSILSQVRENPFVNPSLVMSELANLGKSEKAHSWTKVVSHLRSKDIIQHHRHLDWYFR